MIKELEIIKFRGFKNTKLEISPSITIIAGKNGTSKSTILGLLAQPFVFFGEKHFKGLKKEEKKEILEGHKEYKNIFGKNFETKYSEILKFSPKYDKEKTHSYMLHLDTKKTKTSTAYMNTKSRSRDTIRFNHYEDSNFGTYSVYKNFVYPTLYLGLSRLFPIGESKKIETVEEKIFLDNPDLYKEFKDKYNLILHQVETIDVSMLKKETGETLGVDTGYYDLYSNSAGQDNLGKILGSIFSFKHLKEEMGENYKGGLLLIDELDVTFFAASINKLFDILHHYSQQLQLQIVFTTHSLELLKYIKQKNRKEVKLYYFNKLGKEIRVIENPKYEDICSDVLFTLSGNIKKNKIKIFTEDTIARKFLKDILKNKYRISLLDLKDVELSWTTMKMLNKTVDELSSYLFIYDGDVTDSEIFSKKNNVLKLPVKRALEVEMLNFFNDEESATSEIWEEFGFTQEYFRNFTNNTQKVDFSNTSSCKKVLNNEDFFESVYTNFIKYWTKKNKDILNEFEELFEKCYNNVMKIENYSLEELKK